MSLILKTQESQGPYLEKGKVPRSPFTHILPYLYDCIMSPLTCGAMILPQESSFVHQTETCWCEMNNGLQLSFVVYTELCHHRKPLHLSYCRHPQLAGCVFTTMKINRTEITRQKA